MRELAVPPLAAVPDGGGLADIVFANADEAADSVVLRRKVDGAWRDVTAARFRDEVLDVAKGLVARGVGPGDRVGILSANCYEWTLFDFAVWAAGAVSVPIYVTSSEEQIQWIMSDSGAVAVVVENGALEKKVDAVRSTLPGLREVWRIDGDAVGTLTEAGQATPDEEIGQRRRAVVPDDLATIIYTSGTTGRPKGVVLTHRNLLASVGNAVEYLAAMFKGESPDAGTATLLFLPLAHVFGRMVEVGAIMARSTLGHWADVKTLTDNLAEFRPSYLLSVPYVLEKVYNGARQKAHSAGKGKIFDAAAATAIAYSEADSPGLGLRLKHAVFDRLVYSKLRAALGGQVKYVISGGAALGPRLTHFFRGVGITVFEGYGLTESTAASVVNAPGAFKPGTVGKPLPGTAVRIAEDGEIELRGDGVFGRYWQNEAATGEVFDGDGWFSTGDLGDLDQDGFLSITGRKKEILVTSGGKNVAPSVIEDRITAHPLVGQALVVGDGQKYVAALITVDADYFAYWKTTAGKAEDATVADLAEDPDLLAELQRAVDEGNQAVSTAESVRRFRVLDTEFNPENGYLTPSLKLKRSVIMNDFAKEVESLYS